MMRLTILGCGSSGGVPRLGGVWGACDPGNPKNRRRRCSLLVERFGDDGATRVLIDTSPDMRDQLLDAGVGTLDAVVYTHPHADHVHGLDDLRQIVFNTGVRLPVWADAATENALVTRFGYAFVQPAGSSYPPICDMNRIDGPFDITGAGGTIPFRPFYARHGNIDALGFRIGRAAYLPDAVALPDQAWEELRNLDLFIVDALRRSPHPTHAHLALALDWIASVRPARSVLTNMHVDLDYATLLTELPEGVVPAFDGMTLDLPHERAS